MKTVKVFDWCDMPKEIWKMWYNKHRQLRESYMSYTVGYFVEEASTSPKDYCENDVAESKRIDGWFMENGVLLGEEVLISV